MTTEVAGIKEDTINDSGDYEFDFDATGEAKEKKRVYIIIEKRIVNDDVTRIFDENIRLVVKSSVMEEINPM